MRWLPLLILAGCASAPPIPDLPPLEPLPPCEVTGDTPDERVMSGFRCSVHGLKEVQDRLILILCLHSLRPCPPPPPPTPRDL